MVPGGMETGKKCGFAYGGVLYRAHATEAAGRAMRLSALVFADEGGGAAAAGRRWRGRERVRGVCK